MRRVPLYARILAGMALGMACGLALGHAADPLGELGRVVIQLIKILALPLLFLAVVDAFLRTEIKARAARRMVGVSLLNAALALGIGLTLSYWIRPVD
jgi:DAACS family dicarboxylate/amino acid:cation (Na+ or H+) symporter